MSQVAARKCVRHVEREAVGRCAGCGGHFCRECVGEHDGVMLCAPCLAQMALPGLVTRNARWHRVGEWALTAAAGILLWVVLYGCGQFLKLIPARVHEGTVWRTENH